VERRLLTKLEQMPESFAESKEYLLVKIHALLNLSDGRLGAFSRESFAFYQNRCGDIHGEWFKCRIIQIA
jgi:hypothetical protein